MDSEGLMRFGAYSDSEITKGFCSCLIWVLDGASPEEVAAVAADDLVDLNVGISGRAHSRVNTWHNVLMVMQKKTRDLVEERERVPRSENFPAMVVAVDGKSANTTYAEAEEGLSIMDNDVRVSNLPGDWGHFRRLLDKESLSRNGYNKYSSIGKTLLSWIGSLTGIRCDLPS
ncbi:quinolinate synthase [Actinidia rufa]|uniref:Quinolinate synthase n=1 Tax=Actinidia rufa TaxID=165716 RepID=A0A7J0EPG1_9ERIC|nr:quinolinate synthase [Actinidia rufa]